MKRLLKVTLSLLLLTATHSGLAAEGKHWVCETEKLYRALISSRLYGVGSDPAQGCRMLPTDIPITQRGCTTSSDFEICQYTWEKTGDEPIYWGSPVITPVHSDTKE